MLFHMLEDANGALFGWVLPDNPNAIPVIKISRPDSVVVEIKANAMRTDLQDRGLHETGMVGFHLTSASHPEVFPLSDQSEVRESQTNVLIYRRFRSDVHQQQKLFRFDLRAMPDAPLEQLFAKHFALVYGTAQRYPQDTFFGVFNNPEAKSIYISGRPNMQQYEHQLKERGFKIIALIRNPYEEMAERLLFARYATNPNQPAFIADHIFGLEPLMDLVKGIRFDDIDSIRAAFSSMNEQQKKVLSNPLVRTLGCMPEDPPKSGNVEIALSKLSRMDLVGLRSRFGDFKSILAEVIGVDMLENHELTNLSWVERLSADLAQIKQARALIALDLDLYSYVEEALSEAIGPVPSPIS